MRPSFLVSVSCLHLARASIARVHQRVKARWSALIEQQQIGPDGERGDQQHLLRLPFDGARTRLAGVELGAIDELIAMADIGSCVQRAGQLKVSAAVREGESSGSPDAYATLR
jgi:hypothetical protein